MATTNPYRRKGGIRASTCLVRDLADDDVDALAAPLGEPVRIGGANPWAGHLVTFGAREHFPSHDTTSRLARAMLGFGGTTMVSRGADPDEAAILAKGQLWPGRDALLVKGRPCACHENSSELWETFQDSLVLATGYALSDDGLWRQHSWCVEGVGKHRVIETTTRRLLYLGFAMTAEEAVTFHRSNTGYDARLAAAPERDEDPGMAPRP